MRAVTSSTPPYYLLVATLFLLPVALLAQSASVPAQARITGPVDESMLTTLRGNVHPLALPKFDRGAAPDGLPMERMLLVLRRSPEREKALLELMLEQQDQSSPNFHRWLTPEEFGKRFGPSDQDLQTVTQWLQVHAFQVTAVSHGRMVIEFSGTAGMVKQAFHIEIHKYATGGEEHWANASDPQIPTALTPVVAGVNTLHNFPRTPLNRFSGVFSRSKATGQVTAVKPEFTFPAPCTQPGFCYAVGPYDFATIYNVLPLWTANVTGAGQTIAIVGQTDIHLSDVQQFRAMFGLPANDPQIIYNGPNPGINGDEGEADIDVQWSEAVAPGATIKFVTSQSTETAAGVDLSAIYIVDNNVAPIMSESYGACEQALGAAGNLFYSQMWQQAAAQGISVFVASGDSGSAVCDRNQGFVPQPAQNGLAVSGFASTPFNVSVGGTDLYDFNTWSTYWNTTNSANQSSAKSYIPESTWNDSCTNQLLVTLGYGTDAESVCNSSNPNITNLILTVGGSGGASGVYTKPTWQSGAGVPSDHARDVPDVSLFASNGFLGHFYIVCQADTSPTGTCDLNAPYQDFAGYGGTSVSSPAMAGIMALVLQKNGGPQGNPNPVLYKLAATSGASCTSSATEAASCIFNDINVGTIAMPCATGSLNCNTKTSGHAYGVLSGYATTAGYDLATGLGSVNANNLVNKWGTVSFLKSQTALTLNPTTGLSHGQSVNVAVQVKPAAGSGTPTGAITLMTSDGTRSIDTFTLQSGQASGTTSLLPGGTYSVVAQYGGDSTYGSSASSAVQVTVAKENSVVLPQLLTFDWNGNLISGNATTAVYGSPYLLRVDVKNSSASLCGVQYSCATGSVTLTDNGNPLDGGNFVLNSRGYSEDQTIQLPGGNHSIQAQYPGDASFNASSATDGITITPAPTNTSVAAPGSVTVGVPMTINASTTAQSTGVPPTGTVTFSIDGKPMTGTVSYQGSNTGSNQVLLSSSLTVTVSTGGSHTITAAYGGDSNYGGSTATPSVFSALYTTNLALTANPQTVAYPNSVTVTALVDTQTKSPAPTGSVTFTGLGGTIPGTVSYSTVTDGSGNAALQAQVTYAPSFSDTISANYSGDTNFLATSGAGLAITVTGAPAASFTMPANASPLTVTRGQLVNSNLTLASQGGFSGSVNLTCALPATMKEATCSVQSPVFLAVNGNATPSFTITTMAPHQVDLRCPRWFTRGSEMLVAAVLLGGVRRRKFPMAVLLILLAAMALTSVGCGGGGGGGGSTDPGTPTGTYTVVITGTSGTITQTTNVAVTVQ